MRDADPGAGGLQSWLGQGGPPAQQPGPGHGLGSWGPGTPGFPLPQPEALHGQRPSEHSHLSAPLSHLLPDSTLRMHLCQTSTPYTVLTATARGLSCCITALEEGVACFLAPLQRCLEARLISVAHQGQ